ncbi:hypothetical protein KAZ57_01230 [Patescibacteria group bacterium]|nr:hypothetical protein [Patescibacteria group bacterium]
MGETTFLIINYMEAFVDTILKTLAGTPGDIKQGFNELATSLDRLFGLDKDGAFYIRLGPTQCGFRITWIDSRSKDPEAIGIRFYYSKPGKNETVQKSFELFADGGMRMGELYNGQAPYTVGLKEAKKFFAEWAKVGLEIRNGNKTLRADVLEKASKLL